MIELRKGQPAVTLAKVPILHATVAWPDVTDYDVFAVVLYADGTSEDVSAFGAHRRRAKMATDDGAVKHLGDVRRGDGSMAEETVEIRLNDRIRAVVPVAYSAQSNGQGSFRRHQVSLIVDTGDPETTVRVGSANASDNDQVYSCAIAVITPDGIVVHGLEEYSRPRSENRPEVRLTNGSVDVRMDAGPRNDYKK